MTKYFDLQQLLALHYVYPLPLNKLQSLLNHVKSLQHLQDTPMTVLSKIIGTTENKAQEIVTNYQLISNTSLTEYYKKHQIITIPYTSNLYPKSLFQLVDPPTVLYARGDVQLLTADKKIACIGSRKATNYSIIGLRSILPPLIQQQYVIVSGLARGADTFAHEATIRNNGKTIAVLGHGFFHIYPKENKAIAEHIATTHLLLSEYPPYLGPKKWHFPMRNRIISGLSDALVVTEAALKSGTLITTEHALDHGKEVFVVPGPIHSEQSKGTNKLLKEGAIPVWDGHQIIDELQLFQIKN